MTTTYRARHRERIGDMILHKDIRPQDVCGGQVASGDLFGTDYWCVYCGAKWSDGRVTDATSPYIAAESKS